MSKLVSVALFLLLVTPFSSARADMIISFKDTVVEKHGTGFVDVLVRSTVATTLSGFSALFEISSESSGGVLEFQPTDSQLDTERTFASPEYSYVFLNNTDPSGFSADRQDKFEGGTRRIVASDFASEDAPLIANTDYLLARLEIQHVAPIGVADGTFRIRMVNDPGINSFADSEFNERVIGAESFTNFGTISVTAVPEPSSFVMVGVLGSGALLARLRRKKTMAEGEA